MLPNQVSIENAWRRSYLLLLHSLALIHSDSFTSTTKIEHKANNPLGGSLQSLRLVHFFVSLIYVWILQALNDTIKELTETNQTVKADVYQSLRLALGVVVGCVLLLVGYETIVVRRTDLSYNWQNRWFFTDFGSHCIFFGLLMVMMYLWKPNERSLEYAYSIQLDSKGGVSMGNPVDDADGVDNFKSVDVEIGDGDDDDFSFKKSMQDDDITKDINKKKKLPEVLE